MLNGTIIAHGSDFAFESKSPMMNEPKMVRHVWLLTNCRTNGYSWFDPKSAIGKPATLSGRTASCYMGNGNYLNGQLADDKAILVEVTDIPRPRVRAGIETRWNTMKSRWEKNLKSGWTAA